MVSAALALLAATVLVSPANQPAPADRPAPADDPDLRCVAAVSFVLGASDDKELGADGVSGLTAVFMYYLGKVDARRPGLDYAKELGGLMNAPDYARQLPADLVRCGKEAEERGAMLQRLGEDLKSSVPLVESRPG